MGTENNFDFIFKVEVNNKIVSKSSPGVSWYTNGLILTSCPIFFNMSQAEVSQAAITKGAKAATVQSTTIIMLTIVMGFVSVSIVSSFNSQNIPDRAQEMLTNVKMQTAGAKSLFM